jgi:hypothetical protein
MIKRFFRTTIVTIFVASMLSGSAYAFDEDGFRTGMTVDEVRKQLPKGVRLKGPPSRQPSGMETYYLSHEPLEKTATYRYGAFTFCHGELAGVMKEYFSVHDFLGLLKKFLLQYGQPNKIEATDSIVVTLDQSDLAMAITWKALPEMTYLSYVPHLLAKGKQPESPAIVSVWYDTVSPRCYGDSFPPRPVPFGDLSLNN